ncbi:AraC family transcriptional regulator [Pendulispora rubella]|uniref:AraC family transcriptional regulator n=1 Tax=Pendulispora rubella TaxID=2741070 RepID=A0ABZ2KNZ1_9BACT
MRKENSSPQQEMQSLFIPMLLAYVRAVGGDADAIERKLGIPREPPPGELFPASISLMRDVCDAVEQVLDEPYLGIRMARSYKRGSYGVLEFAARSAPTLGAAVQRLARYQSLVNNIMPFRIESGPDEFVIGHYIPGGRPGLGRHPQEFTLGLLLTLMRELACRPVSPTRVLFMHEPRSDASQLVHFFGTRDIEFDRDFNALIFPADVPNFTIPSADGDLLALLDRFAQRELPPTNVADDFVSEVRRYLREVIRDGSPVLESVATHFHMSPRTFQRRLDELGTKFQLEVDDVRRKLALQYLRDPRVTINEAAFLVGYSDVRPFLRAFRRWTGVAPGKYRESNAAHPEEERRRNTQIT